MTLIKFLGITFITLGGLVVGQIAPRLLIRSDLERFFGAEGLAIQYTGIAHVLARQAYCGGGPAAFTCTAVRITDLKHRNDKPGEGGKPVSGCTFPYTGTAKVYSWFGIPIQTVSIDCNLGTTLLTHSHPYKEWDSRILAKNAERTPSDIFSPTRQCPA